MDAKSVEISNAKYELEKKKKIYSSVNLEKLPDKGARIKHQIEELEKELESLSLKTVTPEDLKNKNPSCSKQINIIKESESDISSEVCEEESLSGKEDTAKVGNINNVVTCKTSTIVSDFKRNSKTNPLEVEKSAKISTFGSNKSNASQNLTFGELAKQSPKVRDGSYVNLPSFSGYRDSKICLTEAKPLFETQKPKNIHYRCFNPISLSNINDECVKKLHHSLVTYPEDSKEESDLENLKSELMMHQKKGLAWLLWREQQDPSGGILADDMGLGKTVTIISLILKQKERENYFAFQKENNECKGTLIVCLASIIHQWNEEILKHTEENSLKVLLYHGSKREKNLKSVMKYDVVLTTYNIVMTEKKSLDNVNESPLFKIKWERIVLDEAHTIKNNKSQTAEAIFCLKAFRKWAVTGTPIHNDFKDMYSLLKFLEFSPFDDYKKFKKMIDDSSKSNDQRRDLLVKSILLRRMKDQVDNEGNRLVEMKNKTIRFCYITLSDEERKTYDKLKEKVTKKVDQFLIKPSKLNSSSKLLVLLLRLQQVCCHISLLKDEVEENETDVSFDITKTMSSLTIDNDSLNSNSSDTLNLTLDEFDTSVNNIEKKSSKMKKLFEKIKLISKNSQNKDKSVIVSQWVSMLNIVAHHLELEHINYHMIVGSTKAEDRQRAAEDFNNNKDGANVMLLSLKAGGVGLNLIGACHLFLLDLHWNPALEMQACDRIHRVGQEKDVVIYKFVCKDTIEERIVLLQNNKRCVASNVLHAKKQNTKGLTMEDFRLLFNVI